MDVISRWPDFDYLPLCRKLTRVHPIVTPMPVAQIFAASLRLKLRYRTRDSPLDLK